MGEFVEATTIEGKTVLGVYTGQRRDGTHKIVDYLDENTNEEDTQIAKDVKDIRIVEALNHVDRRTAQMLSRIQTRHRVGN